MAVARQKVKERVREKTLQNAVAYGIISADFVIKHRTRILIPGWEKEWYVAMMIHVKSWKRMKVWKILTEIELFTRLHLELNAKFRKEIMLSKNTSCRGLAKTKQAVKKIIREWVREGRKR